MLGQVTFVINGIMGIFGTAVNCLVAFIVAIYVLLSKDTFKRQTKKLVSAFLPERHIQVLSSILKAVSYTHLGITKDDMILEIGPGIGTMTQYLCESARQVIAVEIDTNLIPILKDTLSEYDNVKVINDDILKVDINALAEEYNNGKPIKVVANLPYYITTPIIMGLFESHVPIDSITTVSYTHLRTSGDIHMATFTRKAIMQTFLHILKNKPLDRITVKDICEQCEINRNTFYYYFKDIYDVLEAIFEDEVRLVMDEAKEGVTFHDEMCIRDRTERLRNSAICLIFSTSFCRGEDTEI